MSSGAFGWTFGGETVEDMGDFNRRDEGARAALHSLTVPWALSYLSVRRNAIQLRAILFSLQSVQLFFFRVVRWKRPPPTNIALARS